MKPTLSCATAPVLPPIAMLSGETTVGTIEGRSTSCSTSFPSGGTLAYYRMSVPAGRTIAVTVNPSATFDPAVRIFVGCSATTCGAYRNSFGVGVTEQQPGDGREDARGHRQVEEEGSGAVGEHLCARSGRLRVGDEALDAGQRGRLARGLDLDAQR